MVKHIRTEDFNNIPKTIVTFKKLKELKELLTTKFKQGFTSRIFFCSFNGLRFTEESLEALLENNLFNLSLDKFKSTIINFASEDSKFEFSLSIDIDSNNIEFLTIRLSTETDNSEDKDLFSNIIINYIDNNLIEKTNIQNDKLNNYKIKPIKTSIATYDSLNYSLPSYSLKIEDFQDLITIAMQNFPNDDSPKFEISLEPKKQHKNINSLLYPKKYRNIDSLIDDAKTINNLKKYDVKMSISSKICTIYFYLNRHFTWGDDFHIYGENETFCQGKYYALTKFFKTKKSWYSFLYWDFSGRVFPIFFIVWFPLYMALFLHLMKKLPISQQKLPDDIASLVTFIVLFSFVGIFILSSILIMFIFPKTQIILKEKTPFWQQPMFKQIMATVIGGLILLAIQKII